jgi:propanol-preferring alcohol dehydrogenase
MKAAAVSFAAEGKVESHIHTATLDQIKQVFGDLKAGRIDGRMVIKF